MRCQALRPSLSTDEPPRAMQRLPPSFVAILLLAFVANTSMAQQAIDTGEYARSDNSGQLKVLPSTAEGVPFQLYATGANEHSCSVSGIIAAGRARVALMAGDSRACVIEFTANGGSPGGTAALAVEVGKTSSNFENCRFFCGMRAGFEGVYSRVPTACTAAQRKTATQQFEKAYASKHYRHALDALTALQSHCDQFEDDYERDRRRNDIAVTLHHLGQNERCMRELQDTVAASAGNEEALRRDFEGQPVSFDNYLPIARATWNNQKLCTAAGGAPR